MLICHHATAVTRRLMGGSLLKPTRRDGTGRTVSRGPSGGVDGAPAFSVTRLLQSTLSTALPFPVTATSGMHARLHPVDRHSTTVHYPHCAVPGQWKWPWGFSAARLIGDQDPAGRQPAILYGTRGDAATRPLFALLSVIALAATDSPMARVPGPVRPAGRRCSRLRFSSTCNCLNVDIVGTCFVT